MYLIETADPTSTDHGENTMSLNPGSRRRFLPDMPEIRCLSTECLDYPFGFRLDNERIR